MSKSNFKFCERWKCESIIISSVNNNYEPFPEQNELKTDFRKTYIFKFAEKVLNGGFWASLSDLW